MKTIFTPMSVGLVIAALCLGPITFAHQQRMDRFNSSDPFSMDAEVLTKKLKNYREVLQRQGYLDSDGTKLFLRDTKNAIEQLTNGFAKDMIAKLSDDETEQAWEAFRVQAVALGNASLLEWWRAVDQEDLSVKEKLGWVFGKKHADRTISQLSRVVAEYGSLENWMNQFERRHLVRGSGLFLNWFPLIHEMLEWSATTSRESAIVFYPMLSIGMILAIAGSIILLPFILVYNVIVGVAFLLY